MTLGHDGDQMETDGFGNGGFGADQFYDSNAVVPSFGANQFYDAPPVSGLQSIFFLSSIVLSYFFSATWICKSSDWKWLQYGSLTFQCSSSNWTTKYLFFIQ